MRVLLSARAIRPSPLPRPSVGRFLSVASFSRLVPLGVLALSTSPLGGSWLDLGCAAGSSTEPSRCTFLWSLLLLVDDQLPDAQSADLQLLYAEMPDPAPLDDELPDRQCAYGECSHRGR